MLPDNVGYPATYPGTLDGHESARAQGKTIGGVSVTETAMLSHALHLRGQNLRRPRRGLDNPRGRCETRHRTERFLGHLRRSGHLVERGAAVALSYPGFLLAREQVEAETGDKEEERHPAQLVPRQRLVEQCRCATGETRDEFCT